MENVDGKLKWTRRLEEITEIDTWPREPMLGTSAETVLSAQRGPLSPTEGAKFVRGVKMPRKLVMTHFTLSCAPTMKTIVSTNTFEVK